MGARFTFEGLDDIEERIALRALDAAYMVMHDRTERTMDEPVGRFDFDDAVDVPFLDDDLESDVDDESDEDDAEDEDDDETPEAPATADDEARRRRALTARALGWIKDTAARNTVGAAMCRFRVKVYGPKGHAVMLSGQFVCRNEYADDADPPMPTLPAVTPVDPLQLAVDKGWRALGEGYAQYSQVVIGGVSQIQVVNNGLLKRLFKQNADLQEQNEKLVAHILEIRFKDSEAVANRVQAAESDTKRAELIKSGMEQLASITNALLAQKGIPSELADVLTALSGHPKLMETLRDGRVKALLKEPANLDMLSKLLADAGEHYATQQAAAKEPPQGGANPAA